MKYMLLSYSHPDSIIKAKHTISGTYMWAKCFDNGVYVTHKDEGYDLRDYDIVHVEYHPGIEWLIEDAAAVIKNTDTKLIVDIDIAVDYWNRDFVDKLDNLKKVMQLPDLLFHTEPVGANVLGAITGRSVSVLPHPCDIDTIRQWQRPRANREGIACIWHRWDQEWLSLHLAVSNMDIKSTIVGVLNYDDDGYTGIQVPTDKFDKIEKYTYDWEKYIKLLDKFKIAIDLSRSHTYGRTQIEMAALGIPCITSDCIAAVSRLFPGLQTPCYNIEWCKTLMNLLTTNATFYDDNREYAMGRVNYYSPENCKARLLKALEEAK